MPNESWADRAKEGLLYEYDHSHDDVALMLTRTPTNTRVNQDMGRFILSVREVSDCWKGSWRSCFSQLADGLETMYLGLNGYARVQAIEMRGKSAIAEREVLEPKERGGILGIFSGKGK